MIKKSNKESQIKEREEKNNHKEAKRSTQTHSFTYERLKVIQYNLTLNSLKEMQLLVTLNMDGLSQSESLILGVGGFTVCLFALLTFNLSMQEQ